MQVGEWWAYRVAPYVGPVSKVEILKEGTQRPLRVKVRFMAEKAEGREEWVPPARLRVPWERKTAWLEQQQRWADLISDGPLQEDVDLVAATLVFDTCPLQGVASLGWNWRKRGVLFVRDVPAFAALLEVPQEFFTNDPRSFTDDGTVIAPWPTALAAARLTARAHAEFLVSELASCEERERQRAIYGQHYRGRGKNPGTYMDAEICAEVDREFQPARDLVRQWCGAEVVERRVELQALRVEVVRIGKLMEEAIQALRSSGHQAIANQFEARLGVPLELLRLAPEPES
ncbi:hypothetical protein ABUW04_07110 [Streptacidiphilus sp. N1-10]|uniref:PE-PGRS family protein n=1 Tax=Streptacidiphilus jeojiensis TaxID=3229225 RepID=A0ABV6XIF4_9ACTN